MSKCDRCGCDFGDLSNQWARHAFIDDCIKYLKADNKRLRGESWEALSKANRSAVEATKAEQKIEPLRAALHGLHALIANSTSPVSIERLNEILIAEGLDAISLSSTVSEIDHYRSLGVAICDCEAAPNHALGWVATVAVDSTDTVKAGGDDEHDRSICKSEE